MPDSNATESNATGSNATGSNATESNSVDERGREALPPPRGTVVVLCPHFAPDNAPTGTVMTRIVEELAERGARVHVVTSLPWYRNHRVEHEWQGKLARTETTEWGSITRVEPFAGRDKTNLFRRALGFIGFTALAGVHGLRVGGLFRRVDAVLVMSPPLTLAPVGWLAAKLRRARFVLNIQDVFPDAAVETGAIANRWVIGALGLLERWSYRRSAAVTVLSEDLRANVVGKLGADDGDRVRVIPNFVDTARIAPDDRMTELRTELGIGDEPVVLYAGNFGFSQSLEMVVEAARRLPDATFLFNGDGAARADLERRAAGVDNIRINGYVADHRLRELLATGDLHLVPLRAGLGAVSVPSKSYSIMAAGRPVVAAIDPGTAIPRILAESGGGVAVPPDDVDALVEALRDLLADRAAASAMGAAGRNWAEGNASPAAVGDAYFALLFAHDA